MDYGTGEELSISILYLVSICLCTWRAGRRWGLLVAYASAATWLVADGAASQRQGHPLIPYWNAAVLLGFFGVVVYLLSALKASQESLEGRVEHRTSALRREISECSRAEDRLTQANDELLQSRENLVDALPALPMDKNKIEQVLVNIFMNAIQAMPQGGTLTVRTFDAQAGQSGEPALTVEIDDTGPGIPDADLTKVFDPFFTTKPVGQGTGLGFRAYPNNLAQRYVMIAQTRWSSAR